MNPKKWLERIVDWILYRHLKSVEYQKHRRKVTKLTQEDFPESTYQFEPRVDPRPNIYSLPTGEVSKNAVQIWRQLDKSISGWRYESIKKYCDYMGIEGLDEALVELRETDWIKEDPESTVIIAVRKPPIRK